MDSDFRPLQRVVTHRLPPGIYEDLLTTALEAAVDIAPKPHQAVARPFRTTASAVCGTAVTSRNAR